MFVATLLPMPNLGPNDNQNQAAFESASNQETQRCWGRSEDGEWRIENGWLRREGAWP